MLRNCQETLSTPNYQKLRNFSTGVRPKFLIKKVCICSFTETLHNHVQVWRILHSFSANCFPFKFQNETLASKPLPSQWPL